MSLSLDFLATANLQEILWTAAWLVALTLALYKLRMRLRKRAVLVMLHETESKLLINLQSVVLACLLVLFAVFFAGIGIVAMLAPEPLRRQNQLASDITAYAAIASAFGAVLFLWWDLWLQGRIDDALEVDIGTARRTRTSDMARAHQEGVEEGEGH